MKLLRELFQPNPDETSGQTMFRAPINVTLMGASNQQQVQLPKGTVATLTQRLPQKRLVIFSVNGKRYVATDEQWKQAVQL